MTARDDLNRSLTAWLEAEPVIAEPEQLLGQVLARTARTRRRPAWSFPERWIPMELTSVRPVVPGGRMLVIGILALLLVAVVGFALVASGALRRPVPSPLGPAKNGLVVYASGYQIFTSAADGSGAVAITHATGTATGPVLSPDGSRVAYFTFPGPGAYDHPSLVVSAIDGTGAVTIDSVQGSISRPSWSPDGRTIAYGRAADLDQVGRIYVAPVDGSGGPRLISDPARDSWAPTWSPDGTRIAFVRGDATSQELVLMDADGSDTHQLSTGAYTAIGGGMEHGTEGLAWSPDGSRILFSAGTGTDTPTEQDRSLYVVDVASGAPERLVAGGSPIVYGGVWSPSGTRIAYLRGPASAYPNLFVANADGTGEQRVATAISWYTPRWSPDGTSIVFDRQGTVVIIDTAGLTKKAIPQDAGAINDSSPGSASVYDWQRIAP